MNVHPTVPSTRMTRCSSSNVSWSRTARSIAARHAAVLDAGQVLLQPAADRLGLARRPGRGRRAAASPSSRRLIRYTDVRGGRAPAPRNRSSLARRRASARFRSVMSRATFDAPTTRPSASRTGETVREMSSRRPSLATRTVSKCSTRSPRRSRSRIVALLVQPLRRDDQGDGLADGLRGGVAEEPLGPGVPRPDDAVEGLADDRVLGRLDDGRQPRLGLLGPLAARSRRGRPAPPRPACPRSSRIGAALSSIGRSVPSRAIEDGVVRQPDDHPLPQGPQRRGSRPAGGCAR